MNKHQFSHTFEYSKKQATVYFLKDFQKLCSCLELEVNEEEN